MGKLETLYIAGGNVNGTLTLENSLVVFEKVQHMLYLPYDPAIPVTSIEVKTHGEMKCIPAPKLVSEHS